MFKPTILVVEKVFGVNMFLQINVRSLITKTVFYLHTGPINLTNSVLMEIFLLLIRVFSDVMVFYDVMGCPFHSSKLSIINNNFTSTKVRNGFELYSKRRFEKTSTFVKKHVD